MEFIDLSDTFEKQNGDHFLWVEKYRPSKLTEYVGNKDLTAVFENFIKTKDIPHLLLYGTAGTGKTSLAKLVAKEINCDVMYVNASDNTGVDFIREKIKPFISSVGFKSLKVVILDECDYLSYSSQASLRNMMETYSKTSRFILTCNYPEKVLDAIISRCQKFKIEPLSKKEVALYLSNVLKNENISFKLEDVGYIVNNCYPDIRKTINYAQQSVIDNKLNVIKQNSALTDINMKIVEILKSKQSTAFNDIRQIVADENVKHFDDVYKYLFDHVEDYSKNQQTLAILIIAEYMYQSAMVINKEITFMACISKLLKEIK